MKTKYKELYIHEFHQAALKDLADAKTTDNSEKLDTLIDVLSALLEKTDPGDGEPV